MADLDDRKQAGWEDEDPVKKSVFVRERILNRAESRRKWISRIITLIVSAVIFGVVSCVVFVWLKPHAEQWFKEEEPETAIHIPKDEETTAAPEAEQTTEETEDNLEEAVESAVESYQWGVSDYSGMYGALSQAASDVNKGIVTITARTQGTDWFHNTIETVGKASGVIWNITSSEILVLTSYRVQGDETTLEVSFCNGTRAPAVVKAADGKNGIAIISVPLVNVDDATLSSISQVALGNSYGAAVGQPVILVGSPKDYVGSIAYGFISYVRTSVQREDMDVRMLCTDVSTTNQATGFVINMDGQIVGMIIPGTTGINTSAVGISDLKSTIERLSNGFSIAYFGVIGQDVTAEISETHGISRGIYVSEAILEGPAYNAGLQSGDIITALDGTDVLSVKGLQGFLEESEPGDIVRVSVQRLSREGYTEIEFPVTLGVR